MKDDLRERMQLIEFALGQAGQAVTAGHMRHETWHVLADGVWWLSSRVGGQAAQCAKLEAELAALRARIESAATVLARPMGCETYGPAADAVMRAAEHILRDNIADLQAPEEESPPPRGGV